MIRAQPCSQAQRYFPEPIAIRKAAAPVKLDWTRGLGSPPLLSRYCGVIDEIRKIILPIVIRVEYKYIRIVIRVEDTRMVLKRPPEAGEILQGTLDMLILRTLVMGPAHGHTIAEAIERTSENALEVEQGSLYPALHRLEDRGWLSSEWGLSENNRRAKFYRLTARGRKELNAAAGRWRKMSRAIGLILGEAKE
jgi:transcriptional regulator